MNPAIKLLPLFAAAMILPGIAIDVHAEPLNQPTRVGQYHRGGKFKKLNLTADQKAKMQQMKLEMRAEMEKILTPEQKAKLQAMQGNKPGMRRGWKELNLTPEQKARITALRQSQTEKFKAMLTPEQQAEIAKMKEGRGRK